MTNQAVATFDTTRTKRGFTGHEMIDPVGLVHMNGRVYEPEVGRFLSADPVVEDIDNLQTYNRYSYVRNNPLTLTDPSGFYAVDGLGVTGGYSASNFMMFNDGAKKVDLNERAQLGLGAQQTRTNTDQFSSELSNFNQALFGQNHIRNATDSTASETGVLRRTYHAGENARQDELKVAYISTDFSLGTRKGREVGNFQLPPFGGPIGASRWNGPKFNLTQPGAVRSMSVEQARKAVKTLQEIRARQNAHQKPNIKEPYKRPSNATTKEQRESVQGKPCVDCGTLTNKQRADHKDPLVKEYYRTGDIDKDKMRSVDSVQPQCPRCSNRQGGFLSNFSKQMKSLFGF